MIKPVLTTLPVELIAHLTLEQRAQLLIDVNSLITKNFDKAQEDTKAQAWATTQLTDYEAELRKRFTKPDYKPLTLYLVTYKAIGSFPSRYLTVPVHYSFEQVISFAKKLSHHPIVSINIISTVFNEVV